MMRFLFYIIFLAIFQFAFSQDEGIVEIEKTIIGIQNNEAITKSEFDLAELTGVSTDNGAVLEVWNIEDEIYFIKQSAGLSYGRYTIAIYFDEGIGRKMTIIEENFGKTSEGFNYNILEEVFNEDIYNIDSETNFLYVSDGERIFSDKIDFNTAEFYLKGLAQVAILKK